MILFMPRYIKAKRLFFRSFFSKLKLSCSDTGICTKTHARAQAPVRRRSKKKKQGANSRPETTAKKESGKFKT